MKLNQYKGLEVVKSVQIVTDAMVMEQLEEVRKENQKTIIITDRAAELGDEVILDYAGFVGEHQFDGGTAEMQSLVLGSGMFIPGFEEQLVGAAIGAEVDVNVTFPEQYHAPDLAGQAAVFRCKIHEIHSKELYPMDDTFAQGVAGLATLDEMKAVLKKNMEEYAEQMADSQVNDSLLEALVAQCEEVEISDEMMNAEIESAVARISQQMAQQGIPMEAYLQFYGKTMEEFRQDLRPQAENSLKARLALEEVARLEGITVTDEELEAEVELMAREFGISAEQLKTLMGEGIALENLRKDTVVKKTVKVLLDSAVITVEQM